MTKLDKIVKEIVSKSTDTKEQVKAHAKRITKEYEARGFDKGDIERLMPQALQAYYKKQLKSTANAFEGVILGKSNVWDMAKKPRAAVKAKIEELGLKGAMEAGFVNGEGEYLYNDFDWRKGKPIPESDLQRSVYMVADTDDGTFELALLRLRGSNCELVTPHFAPVSFRAVKGKKDAKGRRLLYDIKVSEFEKVAASDFNFMEFFENTVMGLAKKSVIQLADVEQWHDANADDFNRFCFSKVNCVRINFTDDSIASNVMEIDDISLELNMDQLNTVTVWMPKHITVDFPENTMEMILVSQSSQNNEGDVSLNALGVWVHPAFRIKVENKINGENDVSPQEVDVPEEETPEVKW